MVRNFCFWAVWAAKLVLKKNGGHYEPFFSTFDGQDFFSNIVVSALKRCIKSLHYQIKIFLIDLQFKEMFGALLIILLGDMKKV